MRNLTSTEILGIIIAVVIGLFLIIEGTKMERQGNELINLGKDMIKQGESYGKNH